MLPDVCNRTDNFISVCSQAYSNYSESNSDFYVQPNGLLERGCQFNISDITQQCYSDVRGCYFVNTNTARVCGHGVWRCSDTITNGSFCRRCYCIGCKRNDVTTTLPTVSTTPPTPNCGVYLSTELCGSASRSKSVCTSQPLSGYCRSIRVNCSLGYSEWACNRSVVVGQLHCISCKRKDVPPSLPPSRHPPVLVTTATATTTTERTPSRATSPMLTTTAATAITTTQRYSKGCRPAGLHITLVILLVFLHIAFL